MKIQALLAAFIVASSFGCAKPTPPTSPGDEPEMPEGYGAGDEDAPLEATEPEATEPEATEPEAGGSDVSPEPAPSDEPEATKSCAELKKATCKVTQGCAWRDSPKGECIERDSEF